MDITLVWSLPSSIGSDGGQTLGHLRKGGLSDAQHLLCGRIKDRVSNGRDSKSGGASHRDVGAGYRDGWLSIIDGRQAEHKGNDDVVVLQQKWESRLQFVCFQGTYDCQCYYMCRNGHKIDPKLQELYITASLPEEARYVRYPTKRKLIRNDSKFCLLD